MAIRALLVTLSILGAACGGAACGRASAPGPARLPLWQDPRATLLESPEPARPPETLLEQDFAGDLAGWIQVSNPLEPHRVDEGALVVEPGAEEGRPFVTLSGRHGGLSYLVALEPGACYEFEGALRARGIRPAAEPFRGAAFWLGEMDEDRPLAELLREGAPARVSQHHLFPSAWQQTGWQEQRRVFRAGPAARRLWVVCSLGTTEDVLAGAVDFARVRLRRVDPALLWREQLAQALAARAAAGELSAGWRGERVLGATLGSETRPSIVLLPGERLRFTLPLPESAPVLRTGFGPWSGAQVAGRAGELTLRVTLDGERLAEQDCALPAEAARADWSELELELATHAGRTVTLEFELAGDQPGVLGAPLVRARAARAPGPNLLLISIDTLRADHVGAYGYPLGTTPVLDRLANSGILCRDAWAQAPYTLPSHATIFSGQMPSVHGLVTRGRTLSAARSSTLAELLAARGLATQAFTGGGFLAPDFGLDRGFEGFASVDPLRAPDSPHFRALVRTLGAEGAAQRIGRYGLAGVERWVAEHRDERFFLFLHTYAVHDFEAPPGPLPCREQGCRSQAVRYQSQGADWEEGRIAPEDLAHLVHLYDAALAATDERLGRLLERLAQLGLDRNTIVVVTSDHGEELLEHGSIQHGRTLYEELLRVPLILSLPGGAPRTIERAVMLADLAPTLLAQLGVPRDPRMQGLDFLAATWPERFLWSEVDDAFAHKYALREERGWKLVHGPPQSPVKYPNTREWELYDLASDPGERADRAGLERERLAALRAELERLRLLFEELGAGLGQVGQGALDEATRAELEALGYAQAE